MKVSCPAGMCMLKGTPMEDASLHEHAETVYLQALFGGSITTYATELLLHI